jgi:hypothetical protein
MRLFLGQKTALKLKHKSKKRDEVQRGGQQNRKWTQCSFRSHTNLAPCKEIERLTSLLRGACGCVAMQVALEGLDHSPAISMDVGQR